MVALRRSVPDATPRCSRSRGAAAVVVGAAAVQSRLTAVRSRARLLGIADDLLEKRDIHIHVPDGATPKDGPSAGVAMFIALASLFMNKPVSSSVAMTGEISLRGMVFPVGGIKEKVLAALAAGIKQVMLPARNQKDLEDVPQEARQQLEFIFINEVTEALSFAIDAKKP